MSFVPTPEITALTSKLIEPLGAVVAGAQVVKDANLSADDRQLLLTAVEEQAATCLEIVHELSLAIRLSPDASVEIDLR